MANAFVDIDLTFQKHPVTGDVLKTTDFVAVSKALKNLLLTQHYERRFTPDYGSGIRSLLFELISPITANLLQREIENTIKNYEPRVLLKEVVVTVNPDNNSYNCYISFFLINSTENFLLNFNLNRLR